MNYDSGVTIHLVDKVSSGLAVVARAFTQSQTAADALQNRLNKIHSTWQNAQIMAGAGMAIAAPLIKAAHHGEEYLHVLNQMTSAGMSQREIAKSIGAAWETSGKIITSTATENLKVISDLRTVFGDVNEAVEYMPTFAKMQGAYTSILEGKLAGQAETQSFAMAKAIDMLGHVKNKEEFDRAANSMFRVTEATQGRVLPSDYQNVLKYARQAKFGMSEDFLYKKLPELIVENKGGNNAAGGVGPQLAALYRFGVQGIMNKQAAGRLQEMGMIPASSIMKTTTRNTTLKGGVLGSDTLAADPHLWVRDVLVPHLSKFNKIDMKAPDASDKLITASNQVFKGNQGAAALVAEFIKKDFLFSDRGPRLFDKTATLDESYDNAMKNDPKANWKAFHASMENLLTVVGIEILPRVIPMINQFSQSIQQFSLYLKDNPGITKTLTEVIAVSSAFMFVGSAALFVKAAFMGIKFVLSPLIWIIKNVVKNIGPLIARLGGLRGILLLTTRVILPLVAIIGSLIFIITTWDDTVKGVTNSIAQFIMGLSNVEAAFGRLLSSIGEQIASIPVAGPLLAGPANALKGMGADMQGHGNKVSESAGFAMNAYSLLGDSTAAARANKQAAKSKGPGGSAASKTTINQTNNISIPHVPGAKPKDYADEISKRISKEAAHATSASSGNSVGRSYNAGGAHRS